MASTLEGKRSFDFPVLSPPDPRHPPTLDIAYAGPEAGIGFSAIKLTIRPHAREYGERVPDSPTGIPVFAEYAAPLAGRDAS